MVGEAAEYNSASKHAAPFVRRLQTPRLPEIFSGSRNRQLRGVLPMKLIVRLSPLLIALAVVGCATNAPQQAAYVSPLEFQSYNCKQIAREMSYTSQQYNSLAQQNQGGALLGTALAAYMVSQNYAFTMDDSNPQADQLKARYNALHQASIQKNCD